MKKRFVIFVVLTVISVTFTIIFSLSVCGLAAVRTDFADNVVNSDKTFYGTDFTPVIKMGATFLDTFMNEILPVLMYIVFFIVITLLNLALYGFYRMFGLRGEIVSGAEEMRLTHRFFVISALAAVVVTAVISLCYVLFVGSSAYCFFNLLFCWQYPLFVWTFCLKKLKRSLSAEISA